MERILDRQIGETLRVTITDVRWFPAGIHGVTHPYHIVLWRTDPVTWRNRLFNRGRGQARAPLWQHYFITRTQALVQAGWLIADHERFLIEEAL